MTRHIRPLLGLALLLASGCGLLLPPPTPRPTPTASPSPTPWPTSTPEPPDTGWQPLQPGIEWRRVLVETGEAAERLTVARLDPTSVRFRVHYDPASPSPVSGWAERVKLLLVVNSGYFTPENETACLLISEGQVWGTPYGDFAGMFAVTIDGRVSVRWLQEQPYDPDEPLAQALQSFPVLVKPGGVIGFPAEADDGRPSRRTVVAQDHQGRILFIVAPDGHISLHELARFLAGSDLDLDVALNLDGGFSTGMWLKANETSLEMDSLVPVPSVITAEYR